MPVATSYMFVHDAFGWGEDSNGNGLRSRQAVEAFEGMLHVHKLSLEPRLGPRLRGKKHKTWR